MEQKVDLNLFCEVSKQQRNPQLSTMYSYMDFNVLCHHPLPSHVLIGITDQVSRGSIQIQVPALIWEVSDRKSALY